MATLRTWSTLITAPPVTLVNSVILLVLWMLEGRVMLATSAMVELTPLVSPDWPLT